MKFWLAFPLFALAQASCYDYEYYDPVTQASIPGNACAQQAAAAAGGAVAQPIGQPIGATFATTTTQFGQPAVYGSTTSLPTYSTVASTQFAAPLPTYTSAPVYSSAPVMSSYPVSSYPATTVYSAAPLAPTYTAVAQPTVYASTATRLPISTTSYVAPAVTTIAAPVAVATTVRAAPVTTAPRSAAQSSQAAELEYYRALGERQQRQHKQNARIVKEASADLSKLSLVNRVVAGAGNAAPWYPIARLSNQKEVADAYRSEKQIAAKNAEDAYQRYLKDPTRLNMLVSKYQDLNADLRSAAHQYNVINAGTFGQNIAANALGLGGSLTISRIVTQRQQSEDLEDIQRQMQRIARQIQAEAQTRIAAARGGSSQGSVEQRLMGMSQSSYGPQPQRG